MCQECKERWVASHGGNSSPVPVFPDCEDCKKAQVVSGDGDDLKAKDSTGFKQTLMLMIIGNG